MWNSARPIWEHHVLQERSTFVAVALGGLGAVRSFSRNELGRDFVVGDIHGMYSALEAFLEKLSFDPAKDRLFSVGDLIDRGPESPTVLKWLREKDWFFAVRGNHDQFLLDAAADPAKEWGEEFNLWVNYNGGNWWRSVPEADRSLYVQAFSALPFAAEVDCETGNVGIVHADVPEDCDWGEFLAALRSGSREDSYHAVWSRRRIERFVLSGHADAPSVEGSVERVICGHARGNAPVRLANMLMIDTGAAYTSVMPGARFTIAQIHPGQVRLFEYFTRDW